MDHAGESASGLTGYRAIAAFLADGRDPPARRASDPRASRRAPAASLHLVLAAVLEVVHRCADAAGLGAVWEHKVLLRVACARRVLCPVGAVGVLVLASERAHAAHLRAQLHHRRRVRPTLVLSPDVALLAARGGEGVGAASRAGAAVRGERGEARRAEVEGGRGRADSARRSESPQAARGAMVRPSAVLASMSTGCLAALWVISLQTMHECGHSLSMKAGLSMH